MIEVVVALILTLNGSVIEHVYKDKMSACLKSKRVASREVGGERVVFSCKKVKALLQEDKQSKYGMSDCLRSKRMAEREVNPERVVFSCKKVKAKTEIYMGEKKILKLLDK